MEEIIERLKECRRPVRIVAAGSSNTQRCSSLGNAQNWVDWVDAGLNWWYGRSHITINTGISGQTGRQILDRFDTDVEMFDPYILFITCGGNDANPEHGFTPDDFRSNLMEMIGRTGGLTNCHVILQTYYSFDEKGMSDLGRDEWMERFPLFMQVTRDTARETGVELIDHLARWDRLKAYDYELYLSLMHDPQHLNILGHMAFGLDILRELGVTPLDQWKEICAEGIKIQNLMDNQTK